jgi:hypothetical protein
MTEVVLQFTTLAASSSFDNFLEVSNMRRRYSRHGKKERNYGAFPTNRGLVRCFFEYATRHGVENNCRSSGRGLAHTEGGMVMAVDQDSRECGEGLVLGIWRDWLGSSQLGRSWRVRDGVADVDVRYVESTAGWGVDVV